MNKDLTIKFIVVIGVGILFFLGGYGLHRVGDATSSPTTRSYTDQLSGEMVDMTSVVGDAAPNPSVPYFVGFDHLTRNGITNDDVRYIQDLIAHFTVYEKQKIFSKISFVNDSFKYVDINGPDNHYAFAFGIDDTDLYEAEVVSDIIDQTISIKLKQNDSVVYQRSFTLYSL